MSQQNFVRRNQRNPNLTSENFPQYCGYGMSNVNVPNVDKERSDILMQYIGLLLDNQKFMLARFNHLESMMESVITKNTKESVMLREQIEILDDRTKMLADKLEHLCGHLESDDDCDKHAHDDDSDYEQYESDDEDECDCDHENEQTENIKFIPVHKKKKGKHSKGDGITIKVQDELSSATNPLELLFGLTGMGKPKEEKVELSDSDDEYDKNVSIYDENEEDLEDDPNFVELSNTLNNIDDLIELGTQFEEKIHAKQKKVLKKKDKKKVKLLGDSQGSTFTENEYECELYELDGKKYSINLEVVSKLIKPLKKLSNMIGMKKVKDDIFEMIIYYLQGFEKNNKNMLHSVIEGPPGVGKTKLGKTLAQIYCALGIIPSNRFKYVKATDLIGDHVGATKHMTQAAIDEADGGVLFIDEAYALSSNDNKDPYGKECIDTLNFNLSENKKKLIVIIAGYPEYLDKYFFSFNPGLQRRFPFKFRIDNYVPVELRDIFIDKMKRFKWKLEKSVSFEKIIEFLNKNKMNCVNINNIEDLLNNNNESETTKKIIDFLNKSKEDSIEIKKFNEFLSKNKEKILRYKLKNFLNKNKEETISCEKIINFLTQNKEDFVNFEMNNEKIFKLTQNKKDYVTMEKVTEFFSKNTEESMTMEKMTEFFNSHKEDFPNFGGDMENLFKRCQFAHSKRMIGKHPKMKKKLTFDDINNGFENFKSNKRDDDTKPKYPHMYT